MGSKTDGGQKALDTDEKQLEEGLKGTFPASDTPSEIMPEGDKKKPAPNTNA
ncbi:hypothetical protein KCG44_10250 [Pacificimonas sp. WHA3]|uniref:Uncharacterized protein n=1 Tax=Pacificimonas pallii TaxID=2827236 RepID=A0ABS6SH43_9SPHN|nr:hypothetical protein [Pacificimonas pallii]MBV7257162.1 hypothetical protein [Pacificimonas pallii]